VHGVEYRSPAARNHVRRTTAPADPASAGQGCGYGGQPTDLANRPLLNNWERLTDYATELEPSLRWAFYALCTAAARVSFRPRHCA
jgi:hypothetical protein